MHARYTLAMAEPRGCKGGPLTTQKKLINLLKVLLILVVDCIFIVIDCIDLVVDNIFYD